MSSVRHALVGLAAALGASPAGCLHAPEDAPDLGEVTASASSCKPWGCGDNSPVLDGNGFHELHRSGPSHPNPDGLYIAAFRKGPASYRIDLVGTQLVGRNGNGVIALQHNALVGAVVEVRSVDQPALWYDLEIKDVSAGVAAYWQGAPDAVEAYLIEYGGHGLPRETPLCEDLMFPSSGHQGGPMSGTWVVLSQGDRYDAGSKRIVATGAAATGWINFGCGSGTIAKLLLNRHAPVAHTPGFATTRDERQAMLKMFAADYCGDGTSFTRAGEPLAWRDAAGWVPLFPMGIENHEAWWSETGARCLEVPRLDASTDPYPGDFEADLRSACGGAPPPPCSTLPTWPADFGDAMFISANPSGS